MRELILRLRLSAQITSGGQVAAYSKFESTADLHSLSRSSRGPRW